MGAHYLSSRFLCFSCLFPLMLLISQSIAAAGTQEDNYKISISAKNVTLRAVFKSIKKQTGLRFTYINDRINDAQRIESVQFKDQSLGSVLRAILVPRGISWKLVDRAVVLTPKEPTTEKTFSPFVPSSLTYDSLITVSGVVLSEDGSPLVGATIQIKASSKGTKTDDRGRFSLQAVPSYASIIVSNVGYLTRELRVKASANFVISLKAEVSELDETIVIAYGTTTRRAGIGNVSTIKAKDIEKQPINNPLLALQGRVAGLMISQSTGLPGTGLVVRIQGQNSINRGNDPLYVIDGIPFTSQLLPTNSRVMGNSGGPDVLSSVQGTGNPLNFINPADIESIDVLKDAEATAIYGSRAANGAILITTKKGKAGKTKVAFNIKQGLGKVTNRLDLLNTNQYISMRREGKANEGAAVTRNDYDINGLWDTTRYTNWQKELIGGWAKYTDAQATVSGGNANTQFSVATTYHRENSVFKSNFIDRKGALHFNLRNVSDDRRFNFQLTSNYLVDNNFVPATDFTMMSLTLAPDAPAMYNADGSFNWAYNAAGASSWGVAGNPAAKMLNTIRTKTGNLLTNMVIGYNILQDLEAKVSLGYNDLRTQETVLFPFNAIAPDRRANNSRTSFFSDGDIRTWIAEPQLTYKFGLGSSKIDALVGLTFQENKSDYASYEASGFSSDLVMEDVKSAASVVAGRSLVWKYRYNALFGRLNYSFGSKYLVSLSARRDGSSRFGEINRFNNFASVGLGWIFSNEEWLSRSLPFISYGKFRGSYGTSGNDQLGEYQYLNLYNTPSNVGVAYQGATGALPSSIPNPYLEWEKTKKLQVGLDLGVFRDRILLGLNYYRNRSSNQLLPYALPIITGFTSVYANLPATIQNSGLEGSISTVNFNSAHFRWTTSMNITKQNNKLISFPDLENSSLASSLQVGQSISLMKVYNFAGVNPQTGQYQFLDAKGSLTNDPVFGQDQIVFINTLSSYFGGLQNNLRYKSFELDFLFQFTKQKGPNYRRGIFPGAFNRNQPVSVLERWTKPGDITDIQRFSSNANISAQFNAANLSDDAYSDASYIRLKNVQLSWALPASWMRPLHMENSQLYIQGQNLLTFTSYKGLDPESLSNNVLPPLKVATIGLLVNF